MNQEDRMRLEREYASRSDESLLEAAESGRDQFQEGVYDLIMAEIKRRRLQDELTERERLRQRQEEIEEGELELVLLRRFAYMHEAELAKDLLEEEGIEAVILSDDYGGVPKELGFGTGQAKLLVFEDDVERAEELLESAEEDQEP
jgi:hypothetical protein